MPDARLAEILRAATAVGSALAVLGTMLELVNLRVLRRPEEHPNPAVAAVSVLIPARDEAHRIAPTIRSVLAQKALPDAEILVLDDGSTDGTADVVRCAAGDDPRLEVLTGSPPPPGWLGKPHACAQLAAAARGEILVFVDADVVLAPTAVAGAAMMLEKADAPHLVSVWPRQVTAGALGRLVQPLLAWSWLTTVPLRIAERSRRPSLAVANGQFLAVRADALARAGGWAAVADAVLDDIGLARAVRISGGRTGVADGSGVATCRMYATGRELSAGYRKSLWAAFGSAAGAAAVGAVLCLVYVVPPAAALAGSRVGALGYAAAVIGRLPARRWSGRGGAGDLFDAAGHPVSVLALLGLLASSWVGRRRGTLQWKGRAL
ncbi:glycosyltransferase family 2 protein [Mycobacterium sp. PSTR-4-N]|uniref:glycosyltransferase n=1 Tax=Mycobacterium sp. PSTR-4-N TaxID=2917745 RepID=UPI001F14C179|nr:glycosyltransferase family 2 protein [Mycobacterium sp. PSTR-4-N]MCG7596428.1 glycosyltransferase family 2 protein [Mycobacterium sp. PSTR-4-N]